MLGESILWPHAEAGEGARTHAGLIRKDGNSVCDEAASILGFVPDG